MAHADLQSRLEDLRDAMDEAMRFTAGMTYEGYLADPLVRRGVERCIEIVSEASRHIPHERKAEHPQVPWRNVADIGNVLRHGYRLVDHAVIRRPRPLPDPADGDRADAARHRSERARIAPGDDRRM